ncbi:hypothetical protein KTE71_13220 [Burkholderia multivorans]|uniref:hypothetical protein n=1 Tax=Burkholderia multivorans TaxID=87883 RepID=UPI001B9C67EA|nr:hypothetical protein [Burkholderia multivorans]MBR8020789.1 hypothetical protein [Burkholderia multivorans]MBU9227284.1 hypothetical protein [Burkholderia multivorans]MBU9388479.1 hypothetical protein [Burkholderia multivorans]MDN8031161.1 hypothetical protein [Burkholderia multivorans]HEF4732918.1 hypothetical protein [Burkholderia multivorans]
MHRHNTNAVAVSAAALAIGFFDRCSMDVCAAHDQGIVETYEFLAEVALESDEVFNALSDRDKEIAGVWAYDVDEVCGQWIGERFKGCGEMPDADEVRAKLRELADAITVP